MQSYRTFKCQLLEWGLAIADKCLSIEVKGELEFSGVQGHFPWPDASAWTDEELGIPPDDEE